MDKREVSEALGRLAFAAELLGDESVNAAGLQAAAWTIRSLDGDLASLVREGALAKRRDLVKDAVRNIVELVETGTSSDLARLEPQVPAGLFEVKRIKGLGPKKIHALWQTLGITSLAELEYACHENRLVELKGFGKKTQQNVLQAILERRRDAGRLRLDQAQAVAAPLVDALDAAGIRAALAGATRRAAEVVDEIVIVGARDADTLLAALTPALPADAVARAVEEPFSDAHVLVLPASGPRLVLVPATEMSFGAVLLVATGSAAFVDAVVARARAQGMTLGATGLHQDGVAVRVDEEDDVFAALGLLPTPPERREAGVPLVEEGKARPPLVTRADLKGALHNHTTASDGTHSLVEMRDAARALGLSYLGITEHSETAAYAGGLSRERIVAQRREIDALNADRGNDGCLLVHGIESDILKDGALDYDDDTLRALDVVIGSVHQRYGLDRDGTTARLIAAVAHPLVDVVGHPTGRLLLGRKPADLDIEAFLDACARAHVVVELNANPARLDLSAEHLVLARARGLKVSIAADAHSIEALAHLDYGIATARRAGLGPDDVVNCLPWSEARALFAANRAARTAA